MKKPETFFPRTTLIYRWLLLMSLSGINSLCHFNRKTLCLELFTLDTKHEASGVLDCCETLLLSDCLNCVGDTMSQNEGKLVQSGASSVVRQLH